MVRQLQISRMLIRQTISVSDSALARVPLGKGFFAIVDPEDFVWLNKYRWFARRSKCRWYAQRKFVRDGKVCVVRMHRQIMNCPRDMQVHHHNGNTLDNRKSNLLIMEPSEHAALRISR
jgi:hypothetical protein